MEKVGFGGVFLYIDFCDLLKIINFSYDIFMVLLNLGGDFFTFGYLSVGKFVVNFYYCYKYYKVVVYKYVY